MTDKQKFLAIAAGVLVVGVVGVFMLGLNKKPETPAAPPQQQAQQNPQQNAQLPEGHPEPTPSAKPVNIDEIVGKIDAYLQESFPGDWKVEGDKLSKGDYVENDNFKIVDGLEQKLGNAMISIFVGEKRISTNVKQQGAGRAFDYPVPEQVAEVMKTGKEIDGGTSSMGSISYSKVYLPLKDKDGKTVAVMSVSLSQ